MLLEDALDEDLERLSLYLGVALRPIDEGVVPAPGDIQDRAGLLDAVPVQIALSAVRSMHHPGGLQRNRSATTARVMAS